ncbi:hypothetical protein AYO38_05325 [bacterium SCGC AG-212-C10]|nr:hypothetical protein AYO38_05325 [bacterium SCGC AG-212-C10]
MRIAVTGGAGFIGRSLVPALIAGGHSVVVLDNERRGSLASPALTGAECIRGDIRDRGDCRAALAGSDAVVHLAAQANVMGSESDPDYTFDTNVTGTWNAARAAIDAGVGRFVFASSREVYGEPTCLPVREDHPLRGKNLYGATKIAGEAALQGAQAAGLSVAVIRLANVIGRGDSGRVVPNWLTAAATGQPLVVYGGAQILDFIPLETVVAAIQRVLAPGEIDTPVNIGSGVQTSLRELAQRVQAIYPQATLHVEPSRGPEVTAFCADTTRMRTLLGVMPPADPLASLACYVASA